MLTFFKLVQDTQDPVRADRAAYGHMPLDAFRYCEPMRQASSYGWYMFPPISFDVSFDGFQIRYRIADDWEVLTEAYLPNFSDLWAAAAPPDLQALVPPFLRALHSPRGALQIWSGYLVSSESGWSTSVRGLPNQVASSQYRHYEGIVETDTMPSCPLFINIQIIATREVVRFHREEPLFQVQPITQESYAATAHRSTLKVPAPHASDKGTPMSDQDWKHFRGAVRAEDLSETHRMGEYGAEVRRKSKDSRKS